MQLVMDMKNEVSKPIKIEQMSSNEYNNYLASSQFDECTNSNPIDLSRRRDSVETRKTPSPSDSSMFGSSSPSILNDSPSTASLNISNNNSGSRSVGGSNNNNAIHSSARPRPETPTHHYQSTEYLQQFRHSQSGFYPYQSKRNESPSPPGPLTAAMDHRHLHDYTGVTAAVAQNSGDEINPYILHAVALQQKLVQSQILDRPSSNDSSTAASGNIPATLTSNTAVFPMVMGRDGKLSRPFKAYPRNPLSISASLSVTDSIVDRTSTEKYIAFRKQMFEQIRAANGGHSTISNPKMRRTPAKTFVDNIATTIPDVDQYQQQQKHHQQQQEQREREIEMLMQQQQQESQNNALSDSSSNGGGSTGKNSTHKDSAYFERRKKNNAAAKKSRDRRRIKEDEIAIRAAYLERENLELKFELDATKRQLAQFMS